ncbi:nickel/cobalt transporter [Desulfocurvus sp. DL9XJH121]
MMRLLAAIILLAALAVPCLAATTANPFASGGGRAEADAQARQPGDSVSRPSGAAFGAFMQRVVRVQRELRSGLSARVRALHAHCSAWGLLAFLGLALGYGAVHAAGPGHGKAVATSFVLARGEPPARAALLGLAMGAAHAASAVLLVLVLRVVFEGASMAGFSSRGLWLERASYLLVACLAMWIMVEGVRGRKEQGAARTSRRGFWATALATGLVPCPGAAIVLLFSLALGAWGLGLAAVVAMALGMGLTIATAAVLAACCRTSVLSLSAARPRLAGGLHAFLSLAGGLVILALGLSLFLGTFG